MADYYPDIHIDTVNNRVTVTRASAIFGSKKGQQISEKWLREKIHKQLKRKSINKDLVLVDNSQLGRFVYELTEPGTENQRRDANGHFIGRKA